MLSNEFWNLAIALLAIGLLVAIASLGTRVVRRGPVPLMLLFLIVGIAAGSDGLGGIAFDDPRLAYRIGTIALILILFDGGLNTRFDRVRSHLAAATVLATAGVIVTAAVVAGAAMVVGLSWREAVLIGAIVSSTDAAAVFSVLRGSGINVQQRVSATIELESGLNDPMAVILTVATTEIALAGEAAWLTLAWQVPVQLAVGALIGVGVGLATRAALLRMPPSAAGLLPVVTTAGGVIAYGAATIGLGSGFLAVYVCGLVLGNRRLPDHAGVRRVHDFLAWFSQIALFLTLGLLVFPSHLLEVAVPGLAIAAVLVLVARPVAVVLGLLPFRYRAREVAYVAWVGLRGAVPIVLATFPMLAGVPGADRLFHLVFFVVVVSVGVQASTVRGATRVLELEEPAPPPPEAAIEIASMRPLDAHIACYHIDARAAVAGARIAEVPFPPDAAIVMIVRGSQILPGRGPTVLEPGDHVYILSKPEDEPAVALWFGQRLDV